MPVIGESENWQNMCFLAPHDSEACKNIMWSGPSISWEFSERLFNLLLGTIGTINRQYDLLRTQLSGNTSWATPTQLRCCTRFGTIHVILYRLTSFRLIQKIERFHLSGLMLIDIFRHQINKRKIALTVTGNKMRVMFETIWEFFKKQCIISILM